MLQQNGNLPAPAGWANSSGVTTSNVTNSITVTPPVGNLFFRNSGMVSTCPTPMKRSRVFTMHAITSEKVENSVAARM
jgi:hypothetical protein